MSEREQVQEIIDTMPDYQITGLLGFLRAFAVDAPNRDTLDAMENAENDTDMFGPFDSVEDLMEALNA